MVTVDNSPAVCHNLTCDFTYIDPVGEITAFSFDSATNKLIITGTELPVVGEIYHIQFAKSFCTIDESVHTATNIECTLDQEPVCGDHLPILTHNLGLVPLVDSIVPDTIVCTLTSITPNIELSLWG
jgi:hypothetical protein